MNQIDRPATLIVGVDSKIGSSYKSYLDRLGESVLGTIMFQDQVNETTSYLNLEEDVSTWQIPDQPIKSAIFCSGITNTKFCTEKPFQTAKINVEATLTLLEMLVKRGIFVVFISSNQVFDGTVPNCLPNEATSPKTEYGRQKAEVEKQLLKWGEKGAVVRLTKVLEPNFPLFVRWINELKEDRIIQPFTDMVMSPISMGSVITVLKLVTDHQMAGVMNISGNKDLSYAESAKIGAKVLGLNEELIQPISSRKSGIQLEYIPEHTTLNIDLLRSTFGIEPTDVEWTIKQNFLNANKD